MHASQTLRSRVAAIVCTIERPATVAACTRTLLANTYDSLEVIVVDQSIGGDIAAAILPLAETDSRLKYMHTEIAGKTRAQNLAINSSDADIFVFTDDDCIVPVDWVSSIVATFHRLPNAGLLFGEVHRPEGHDWSTEYSPSFYIPVEHCLQPSFLPRADYLYGCSMAVRRETFRRIGLFDERLGPGGVLAPANEEVDFQLRALRAHPPVGVYLTPAFYVVHEYGSRPQGEATRQLLRAYEAGKSAMLTKHALQGDIGAACQLLRIAPQPVVDGLKNLIRTGRPRRLGMIVPYLQGIVRGLRVARTSQEVLLRTRD